MIICLVNWLITISLSSSFKASRSCERSVLISPSIFRNLVCLRFPPRLAWRYIGRFKEGVRTTRYGRIGLGAFDVGCTGWWDVAAVFAVSDENGTVFEDFLEWEIDRRRWYVEARGKARGRRNERYIEDCIYVSAIVKKSAFIGNSAIAKSWSREYLSQGAQGR